jgi:hypothetical protein
LDFCSILSYQNAPYRSYLSVGVVGIMIEFERRLSFCEHVNSALEFS